MGISPIKKKRFFHTNHNLIFILLIKPTYENVFFGLQILWKSEDDIFKLRKKIQLFPHLPSQSIKVSQDLDNTLSIMTFLTLMGTKLYLGLYIFWLMWPCMCSDTIRWQGLHPCAHQHQPNLSHSKVIDAGQRNSLLPCCLEEKKKPKEDQSWWSQTKAKGWGEKMWTLEGWARERDHLF